MDHYINLNSDLGESFGNYKLPDAEMLDIVSSANLACGFHAGDPMVMYKTVEMCAKKNVAIGAHVGYPDLQGFGRRRMQMTFDEIYNITLYQLGALEAFTRVHGVKIRHMNAHGALGNISHKDIDVARAVVKAAHDFDENILIWTQNEHGCMAQAAKEYNMGYLSRVFFIDRNYDDELFLVPRGTPDAMITDEDYALKRVIRAIMENHVVTVTGKDVEILPPCSIMIHGDQPKAVLFAKRLRKAIDDAGIIVRYAADFPKQ